MARRPEIDETRNQFDSQVVGNKDDTVSGTSLVSLVKQNAAATARVGDVWYVDKYIATTGDGRTWGTAFKTMTEAITAAGDYDEIHVGPGVYAEAAVMNIDQAALKIKGTGNGGQWGPCGFSSATSGDDIMTINADRVEISGIAFWCVTNAKDGIVIGTTYDSWNTWIHDCAFGTGTADNTLGEYGVQNIGVAGSLDVANTLIEDCYFHYMSTAGIQTAATRATIRRNLIWSSSIGIDVLNEGAAFSCCAIYDNHLVGKNAGTGIKLAATEPTDGNIYVGNNNVTNFSVNITPAKGDAGLVNNGTYGDGTSWTGVDPT